VNEGALLAARKDKKTVGMEELEEAIDRVIAGPERKSRLISTKEKEVIAYHETGHALVATFLPHTDPVHKISILPRGLALGYTLQLPIEDKYLISKTEIENQIKILLGGRVAESIVVGEITSGASNDIEKATELARNYVCQYGMSDKLGPRKYGHQSQQVFLGRDFSDHSKDYAEATAKEIDQAIHDLIDSSYQAAERILIKNKHKLVVIAKVLMEKEIIEGKDLEKLLKSLENDKPKPAKKVKTT